MAWGDRLERAMDRLRKRMDEGGGIALPTAPEPEPTAEQLACRHSAWAVSGSAPDGTPSYVCADCWIPRSKTLR